MVRGSLETTPETLVGVLERTAAGSRDKVAAIAEDGTTRTYDELWTTAQRLVGGLDSLGAQPGDRVCLLMANQMEWIELFFACAAGGFVCVPANPAWTASEMRYLFEHSQARVVVCRADDLATVRSASSDLGAPCSVVVVGDGAEGSESTYAELAESPAPSARRHIDPEEPAMIVYTSGTTSGRPKGVVHSHRVVLDMGRAYGQVVEAQPDDRCLFVTPLFHLNAVGAFLGAFSVGASVVFQPQFSASRFWRMVDTYRPTYFFSMVTIVNILLAQPPTPMERNHRMRAMLVLGSGNRAEEIEQRLGAKIIDCYGMSEFPPGTYTRLDEPRRPGSAGRPFFDGSMRILREDGSETQPGEAGEVVFSLEHGFIEYFNDPEETARTRRDGWFRTGDLGYFDEDGYFYFADRLKDIIRRGGENISSIEVESVLRGHPGIADVAVVPRPDDVLGDRVAAIVVLADGVSAPTLEQLRQYAEGKLAEYKWPESLLVVDELPRTPTGKIQKSPLRRLVLSGR